jgi:hypothetical protein
MTRAFIHGRAGMPADEMRALVKGRRTGIVPILDADGHLVDYATGDAPGGASGALK